MWKDVRPPPGNGIGGVHFQQGVRSQPASHVKVVKSAASQPHTANASVQCRYPEQPQSQDLRHVSASMAPCKARTPGPLEGSAQGRPEVGGRGEAKPTSSKTSATPGGAFRSVTRHRQVGPPETTRVSVPRPRTPGTEGAARKPTAAKASSLPRTDARGAKPGGGPTSAPPPPLSRGDPGPTKEHEPLILEEEAEEEASAAAALPDQGRQPRPHPPPRRQRRCRPRGPSPTTQPARAPAQPPAPAVTSPGDTASAAPRSSMGFGVLEAAFVRLSGGAWDYVSHNAQRPPPRPAPSLSASRSSQTTFPDRLRGSPALPPETRAELGVRSGSRSGSRSPPPPPPPAATLPPLLPRRPRELHRELCSAVEPLVREHRVRDATRRAPPSPLAGATPPRSALVLRRRRRPQPRAAPRSGARIPAPALPQPPPPTLNMDSDSCAAAFHPEVRAAPGSPRPPPPPSFVPGSRTPPPERRLLPQLSVVAPRRPTPPPTGAPASASLPRP